MSGWNDADLCRSNGWGVGTRLVGDEGYGPTVIEITGLGERSLLAKTVSHKGEPVNDGCERAWTLACREWTPVALTPVRAEGTEGLVEEHAKRLAEADYNYRVLSLEDHRELVDRIRALTAEAERAKSRGDNHWETLRGIRDIARTSGDLQRIIQWVNDAGSGYTERPEATIAALMDRTTAAESRATASEAKVAGLVGALESARDTILQLYNMRGCEAEGSSEQWTAEIDSALSASGPGTGKDKCAICGGKHDNDLLSDICKRCEDTTPWCDEAVTGSAGGFDYADAAVACRETAAELRGSNSDCNTAAQAIHWEDKAKEYEALASEAGEQKAGAVQVEALDQALMDSVAMRCSTGESYSVGVYFQSLKGAQDFHEFLALRCAALRSALATAAPLAVEGER